MNRRRAAALVVTVAVLAACDSPDPSATTPPSSTTVAPRTTPPVSSRPIPGSTPTDDGGGVASPGEVNPDEPIAAVQLTPAPVVLGPMFVTGNEPLPAQTTAALRDAGGQALDVNTALTAFGVLGIPRPSGASSAVMELDVTATRLAGTDGTSLSTEVLYLVSSTSHVADLLVDAAHTIDPATPSAPSTVPDYDGTTGDPRCARLPLDSGTPTAVSVEGCEYRGEPLTEVRSIGFRRLNLLVAGAPVLPPVFADVPAELLVAGELAGYTASFGRPAGPAGNTVQLRLQVRLAAPLTGLGDGWHADGPGRWWTDTATVNVVAGTATWQSSTRAAEP
jgi:hypothetical protein